MDQDIAMQPRPPGRLLERQCRRRVALLGMHAGLAGEGEGQRAGARM
jgi:hypothetical protein